MNELQVFNNGDFGELRVMRREDGEPWFVAKDVCEALGLSNVTMAIQKLDEDEFSSIEVVDSLGRAQQMVSVNEAGLYGLVLGSRKPEARAFKRWVKHDVLPAIRKHGVYATQQSIEKMLADPDTMIATLTALKAERERSARLAEDAARMLPKATMYDIAIEADGTMTVTQAARYLGQLDKSIKRNWLFAHLRADGMLCKQGNAPTRYAVDHGYMVQMLTTRSDGKANEPYARLTRKGLDWCVNHYCAAQVVEA